MMNFKIPYLDLRVTDPAEKKALLDAVDGVLSHGRLILGPEVEAFEKKLAEHTGRAHAIGVSSGTNALYLALLALGIGPGDEVITTSLSWIATANAIALVGATPVFAEVRDDFNIDPKKIEELITPATRALLPVHFTGKICEMAPLLDVARNHEIHLIEDACQAFGARHHQRPAGSFGDIVCLSMNSMKVLASCGEAGAILTDDAAIAKRLHALRYNGVVDKTTCLQPSINARLETVQAAILLARWDRAFKNIRRRREIAAHYNKLLKDVVQVPSENVEESVHYTYNILTPATEDLGQHLKTHGIETKRQVISFMPGHPAFASTARGRFAKARLLAEQALSLPMHEKLKEGDVDYVAQTVRAFFKR